MTKHFFTKVAMFSFSLNIVMSSGEELERRLSAIDFRLTTSREEVKALESRLTSSREEVKALESRLTSSREETRALKRRLSAVESHLNTSREETKALESRLSTAVSVKQSVAFLAQFSRDSVITPASGPFKFDGVVFNDGGHYDGTIGICTAPVAGVYLFTAQFYLQRTQTHHPIIDLVVNGSSRLRMAFNLDAVTPGHDQESRCIALTLKLAQGNRVWIESFPVHPRFYYLWGSFNTFFSGALLYAQ